MVELADLAGVSDMTVYRTLRRLGLREDQPVTFEQWLEQRSHRDGACRRWDGAISAGGYPVAHFGGVRWLARRLVWEHFHGTIPPDHDVLVTAECRYTDCVEPGHLRLISVGDRLRELTQQHRFAHGEQHWNARLTEQQALSILTGSESVAEAAHRFAVSQATVHAIRAGRRWAHLRN